jgi:tRNA(Ile)-lysidine synthase
VVHIREFLGEITQPVHLVFKDDFVHQVTIDKNPKHAFFDFDALTFPLVLRPWKAGDVIQPFGMKGTKKVSDIINEAKIPLPKKPLVYVLESNRTIIWVVGLRAANTFKVTPKTQRIYAIESHSTK